MEEEIGLGKLLHTLKKKCLRCSSTLQLRQRQIDILIKGDVIQSDYNYEYCNKCDTENKVKSKIKRSKKYAKLELVEKEELKKEWKPRKDFIKKDGVSNYSKPKFPKKG